MDQNTVKKLRRGEKVPGVDPKELALIRFGRKMAKDPTQISATDIQALREKRSGGGGDCGGHIGGHAFGSHQLLCQCLEDRAGCGTRGPE